MQAIVTKYLPATHTRGARVAAYAHTGDRIILPYRHNIKANENHAAAARAMRERLGWTADAPMIGAQLPDGQGFAWIHDVPGADRI